MKKLLAILLAVCMIMSFAACAPSDNGDTTPNTDAPDTTAAPQGGDETTAAPADEHEPVTLRFWQAGGDTVGASTVMRLLLDQFENQYDWITVEYQAIPWSNDPHTQFQTGIASGDIADVLVVGSPLDFELAGNGQLLALDDLLTDEVKNDISDVLKNECVYKGSANEDMVGKMMSLPLYGGTRAILYNKEIFDFFGVEYPTTSMTHAELLEMAKKLTGDMNGTKVYGYGTRATDSAQYLNFVWNYGAQIIDSSTMQAATNTPEWKAGIEDLLAFYEAGVTPEGSSAMDATTQLNMFMNGEIAMFVAAVDYAQTIVAEDGWSDKLGVAALPHETYATSYCGADVLVVPNKGDATQTEATALLLNYLMSTNAQATYCKTVGFFPGVKSAAEDPYFSDDPIQAGYAATMEGAHYFGNYGVSVGSLLRANIQMLLNGEVDIDTYMENLTNEINAKIAEAN